jgi:hypothetical protein
MTQRQCTYTESGMYIYVYIYVGVEIKILLVEIKISISTSTIINSTEFEFLLQHIYPLPSKVRGYKLFTTFIIEVKILVLCV